MEPITIHSIEDVLEAASKVSINQVFTVDGVSVKKTDLLQLVENENSVTCVECGQSALYFTSYDNPDHPTFDNKLLTLMFEHTSKLGTYAFMTKDHIIPKYHKVCNAMVNYQLMCNICNTKKGHSFNQEDLPEHLIEHVNKHNIPLLPKPKGEINKYLVEVYKGYIRWYTAIFHQNSKLEAWNSSIRQIIEKQIRKLEGDKFDLCSYNYAYKLLAREVKEHNKKRAVPLKPATMFRYANGMKSTRELKKQISTRKLKSSLPKTTKVA